MVLFPAYAHDEIGELKEDLKEAEAELKAVAKPIEDERDKKIEELKKQHAELKIEYNKLKKEIDNNNLTHMERFTKLEKKLFNEKKEPRLDKLISDEGKRAADTIADRSIHITPSIKRINLNIENKTSKLDNNFKQFVKEFDSVEKLYKKVSPPPDPQLLQGMFEKMQTLIGSGEAKEWDYHDFVIYVQNLMKSDEFKKLGLNKDAIGALNNIRDIKDDASLEEAKRVTQDLFRTFSSFNDLLKAT